MAEPEPVLGIADLRARPSDDVAIEGLSLEVREYEVVGLVGVGAGTVLDCVSGHLRPTGGTVRHRGLDVTTWAPHRRARAGIARTFRGGGLPAGGTVLDGVLAAQHSRIRYSAVAGMLGSPAAAATERVVARRALDLLEILEVPQLATTAVGDLAVEARVRAGLATALALDPDVALLDGPADGLGTSERAALAALLVRLRRDLGVTLVVRDDRLALEGGLCDFVYALHGGRHLVSGSPAEVERHPTFQAHRLGEEGRDGPA